MTTVRQKEAQKNRDSVFVETGDLLSRAAYAGNQYIQRIHAPKCAAAATAGSFVHIACDAELPMRRPLSIMRARDDWIEVLHKTVGDGLDLLSQKDVGDSVSVLGPIGNGFKPDPSRPNALLIGGGVGIPPMVFLADVLRNSDEYRPLALLGSEIPFPFDLVPSQIVVDGIDLTATHTMPLLESWQTPARLTSQSGYEGCFNGYVTDLALQWLTTLSQTELDQTKVFSCGPTPMLKAVAKLAEKFSIPCEVSLEEFMACAVGGCAGCTVLVTTDEGSAMKRVCVDGPVFDARSVVWD